MRSAASIVPVLAGAVLAACAPRPAPRALATAPGDAVDAIAQTYVKLLLALGVHDPDAVDAYSGPPAWRDEMSAARLALDDIARRADTARAALGPAPAADSPAALRRRALAAQLGALATRARVVAGRTLPFEEEARAIYGVVPPRPSEAALARAADAIDRALPGAGSLAVRLEAFRARFHVPPDRLRAVVERAIAECRARTLPRIALPAGESFSLELVSGRPWAGYNWYQGGAHSLIQVNTDLPMALDHVLEIGCHEGYPGHHAWSSLQDANLARARGWVEYTAYALFSPASLLAEGSANHGVDLAFPRGEKLAFERDVLCPMAGLDPREAARHAAVEKLAKGLRYARNEAARRLLDGEITEGEALAWLDRYALLPPERARKSVDMIRRYRSYVVNYNYGEDLVAAWVARRGGDDPDARWRAFELLLTMPRTAADLL